MVIEMNIDISLQKIENAIKTNDILKAFHEIKITREKYAHNRQ